MKTIRILATGLLVLTGIVHVAQLLKGIDGASVITALFGLAYLAIAYFIFRESRRAYWFGALLPLLGILLTLPALLAAPSTLDVFFVAVDIVVIGCCAWLIYRSK